MNEKVLSKVDLKKSDSEIYPPFERQHISPPGVEEDMSLKPRLIHEDYEGSNKLKDKVALVTGGDSGIGRSICLHFAIEGASVAFTHLAKEYKDAEKVSKLIENEGQEALSIPTDFLKDSSVRDIVDKTVDKFGKVDILINNAAFQNHLDSLDELSEAQFQRTYQINVFSIFKMVKAVLPFMSNGSAIINTGSILGYIGSEKLIDYSSAKGAIHSLTKSLAKSLASRNIRVNSVAPGPVWTPLNPAEREYGEVKQFGSHTQFGRPAQPAEIAPAYVYLASDITGGYITGETINIFGDTSGAN